MLNCKLIMSLKIVLLLLGFVYTAAFGEENVRRTFSGNANILPNDADVESLLRRFEANEKLVQQLVEREAKHSAEIMALREDLEYYKRRSDELETFCGLKAREDNAESSSGDGIHSHIRRAQVENKVAFSAGITNHLSHVGVNQTYVFDHALTNIGNAYNIHNGNFIAPIGGTYVFSVTLMSLYHINAHSRYFKNGQPITWMYVSGGEAGYDTTSQTIVLQLVKGDDVSVRNTDTDVSMAGAHYSTFSGFLLYENSDDSVIVGK